MTKAVSKQQEIKQQNLNVNFLKTPLIVYKE